MASIGMPGTQAGLDDYCIPLSFSTFCTATVFIPFVNDTLIFTALTWRILRTSYKELTVKNTIMTVTLGKNIPYFARALLQNGQLYTLWVSCQYCAKISFTIYSTTFVSNLAALLLYIFDSGNPSLAFASIMVMNVMASRIYRNTKLGRYNSGPLSTCAQINSSLLFANSSDTTEAPLPTGPNQSNSNDIRVPSMSDPDSLPPLRPKNLWSKE